MKGARVRRAVTEECDRDALLVAHLKSERRAHDSRNSARDDRVRAEVAHFHVVEMHRAPVPVRAAFDLPVQLGHDSLDRRTLGDRVPVRAMGRGDDVLALERRAHACGDGLLPDRDVEEARQLARPKALLDLLLEASDEQHLAEEPAQSFLRDPPSAGAGLLLHRRHERAIMLIRSRPPLFVRGTARVASER